MSDKKDNDSLICSFCAKDQNDVRKLIAGPEVYICNECVVLCGDIIHQEDQAEVEAGIDADSGKFFLLPPNEIHAKLDEYVIGQQHAKRVLSVAVYNHYKRLNSMKRYSSSQEEEHPVELSKSNILMIGPTGSGKTLLAQTLARVLNVPFAIADATTLTEAGYVGEDVENIVQKLLQKCDYDITRAQMGIIYIDEIDKISRKSDSPSLTRDVSGEGVQQALLKLIEGTVAAIPPQGGRKHPQQEYLQVDTTNILFICAGAFSDLYKIVRDRTEKSGIGFSAEVGLKSDDSKADKLLKKVEPQDIIRFGLIPEFVGRLPVITILGELGQKLLMQILKEPKNSLTKQYSKLFELDGVSLEFTDGALREIANHAVSRKTGARGLRSILENILLDIMYDLPNMAGLQKVVVDEKVITHKGKPLLVYASIEDQAVSE